MSVELLYWILMLLWLVWGAKRRATPELIPFLLFLILGWLVLGQPAR